jgi:Acyl-CoA reductase (LuxC)
MAEGARRARVERLLEAARVLASPERPAGQALRKRLLETTGLSAPNIELGLTRCLETRPAAEQLEALLAGTPEAPRAHVLLSANVFVAALRAIALGLASSASVQVRASRREPALAEALHGLVPDLFELKTRLSPEPGEHFWAYGSDATLSELRGSLAAGVWFHPHGAGIGAIVVDPSAFTAEAARAIALDTALFDQRGCLSPRVVAVIGGQEQAENIAKALAHELATLDRELPPGPSSAEDAAAARRSRDAAAYAFELFQAGSGWVSCAPELVVPPALRSLHVSWTSDPARALSELSPHLTCIATSTATLRTELGATFGGARLAMLGYMQRPPLDGPVDRRHGTRGELVR